MDGRSRRGAHSAVTIPSERGSVSCLRTSERIDGGCSLMKASESQMFGGGCLCLSLTASLNTLTGQRRSHRWMILTCINWSDLKLSESSEFFKIICCPSQVSNVGFHTERLLFPPLFELQELLPYWFCIMRTTMDWASANQSKPTLISNSGAKNMLD